jgi:hypothetical protein
MAKGAVKETVGVLLETAGIRLQIHEESEEKEKE